MRASQAKVPERRSVGAKLVGRQRFRRETLSPEQLAHQPERRPPVAPALNQHIENLALMVDSAPKVQVLAGDPDHHLVQMPSVARAAAALPQFARDYRAELQNPAPHRLVRDIEPTLRQEILHVAVAQCEAEIEPNRVLDDRRRKAWRL